MIACPTCNHRTAVVETRVTGTSVRRRRTCEVCKKAGRVCKLTTIEVVVPEGKRSMLGTGSAVVSARDLEQLRKIVTAICEGAA